MATYDRDARCACGDKGLGDTVDHETLCLHCGQPLSHHTFLHPHGLPSRGYSAGRTAGSTCSGFMGPWFYPGASSADTADLIRRDRDGGPAPEEPSPDTRLLELSGNLDAVVSFSTNTVVGLNNVYVALDRAESKDHAGGWLTPAAAMELAEAIIEAAVRAEES
jgi:hypothetical protein